LTPLQEACDAELAKQDAPSRRRLRKNRAESDDEEDEETPGAEMGEPQYQEPEGDDVRCDFPPSFGHPSGLSVTPVMTPDPGTPVTLDTPNEDMEFTLNAAARKLEDEAGDMHEEETHLEQMGPEGDVDPSEEEDVAEQAQQPQKKKKRNVEEWRLGKLADAQGERKRLKAQFHEHPTKENKTLYFLQAREIEIITNATGAKNTCKGCRKLMGQPFCKFLCGEKRTKKEKRISRGDTLKSQRTFYEHAKEEVVAMDNMFARDVASANAARDNEVRAAEAKFLKKLLAAMNKRDTYNFRWGF
jgi:hypothetical protein